jgi:hypothetical protein
VNVSLTSPPKKNMLKSWRNKNKTVNVNSLPESVEPRSL